MQVPLLDLKAQYVKIRDEMLTAVTEVLDSQICINGPRVVELEEKIAAASDCKYGVGASSGTDAILMSLMALGIGAGDEVITTPFTFFATAGCIHRSGAKAVFVDIDPKTYNIDVAKIEAAITDKTKAILPVHLFGQMADMDAIMAIAKKHNLYVIEDAAQSVTSSYKGKKAGSFGTIGCFSFYPSKNLGGIGDGGMTVTNDEEVKKNLLIMRNHGGGHKYFNEVVGGNFRLDALQAAGLLVKLKYLDEWSQGRRDNAAYYNKKFAGTVVETPYIDANCVSIYNQYVVRVPKRDEVLAHLREKNIGCCVYYPLGLHMQKCFEYLGYKEGDMPETEKACSEVIALPVYPELTDEMKDFTADTLLAFLS
jgi:dTDP-4-amino-4,6-dideoxygalactose transaminase